MLCELDPFALHALLILSLPWGWQGSITFHDVIDNAHDHGLAQIRLEGVYIWPFRQLRIVANRYLSIFSLN
jgi:hypothetical protein